MYRVYAQDPVMKINLGIRRRLAPLLGNDRRQIELLNSLLLSLPGTPVLYYGDEIGMGDNVYVGDRNGVRTPMQWSSDRNAGFSRVNPQKLYLPVVVDSEYHYEAINVEAQRANPNSLWYAMKRLIATRKRFQALGRGSFELLPLNNRKVLAFTRTYEQENILVVVNFSRFVQTVELDLSAFEGVEPVEIFGQTKFPAIGDSPYFLSLSPYGFYWLTLTRKPTLTQAHKPEAELPTLLLDSEWQNAFSELQSVDTRNFVSQLELILSDYLYTCSWFGGKNRKIQSAKITESISVPYDCLKIHCQSIVETGKIVWLQVEYIQGTPETYLLPLAYAEGERAVQLLTETPQFVICRLQRTAGSETVSSSQDSGIRTDLGGVLFDGIVDENFTTFPLAAIAQNLSYKGLTGELSARATDLFARLSGDATDLEATVLKGEQSNNYVIYGDRLFLKIFRKVEEGLHPDLEIRRFLSEKNQIKHFAPIAGALEYRRPQRTGVGSTTIGILQEFIPNTRSSWDYTLDSLQDFFDQVITQQAEITEVPVYSGSLLDLQDVEIPELAAQTFGSYLVSIQRLGESTAEMHIALASAPENPDFAPEPFSSLYQRSLYQYCRNLTGQVFLLLKDRLQFLSPNAQDLGNQVLLRQEEILRRFQLIVNQKMTAMRTRYHGDYHLGKVLYTGKDFIIFDFEGREARSLSERRMKRSPLRDVAGMVLSFNYAVSLALQSQIERGMIRSENLPLMEAWSQFWYTWVSATFLKSYLKIANQDSFLPKAKAELQLLLDAFLLEKVISAIDNELKHCPEHVEIPLQLALQFSQ